MDFPEITTWIANLTVLVRIIGVGTFLIAFPLAGIMLMTAIGSERRETLGKTALICAVVGLFIILIAPVVQIIIARIAGVPLTPQPGPIPTLTPIPKLTPILKLTPTPTH